MAGIFGITDENNGKVISLGFIITHKFKKESFDELKWTDQETDELKTISRDVKGETEIVCNNSDDTLIHTFR